MFYEENKLSSNILIHMENVIALFICLIGLGIVLFGRLIYRTAYPKRLREFPSGAGEAKHPKELHWPYEDFEVPGHEGTKIRGWIVPAVGTAKAVLLLLHGHRKNKTQMLGRARFLRPAGYALVFVDHRHHGESDDSPFGLGYFGRLDLAEVIKHLQQKDELKDLPICALGLSLGATTAIATALDGAGLSAVIADSPTSDQAKTLAEYGKRLYFFPETITMAGLKFAEWWWQMNYEEMNLEKRMSGNTVPILIIHGEKDQRVPIHHAQKLAATKAPVPLRLETFAEANHVEAFTKSRKKYERIILDFLNETLST